MVQWVSCLYYFAYVSNEFGIGFFFLLFAFFSLQVFHLMNHRHLLMPYNWNLYVLNEIYVDWWWISHALISHAHMQHMHRVRVCTFPLTHVKLCQEFIDNANGKINDNQYGTVCVLLKEKNKMKIKKNITKICTLWIWLQC